MRNAGRVRIAAGVVLFYVRTVSATGLYFIDASVDRAGELRLDEQKLRALRDAPDARYLLLRRGRVKAEGGTPPRIAWLRAADLAAFGVDPGASAFLGLLAGQPRFAVIPQEVPLTANDRALSITDDGEYMGLRKAAATMPSAEAQLAAHAVHLSNWINRNRYCGSCAAPMRLLEGGHKLGCSRDGCTREEFPRTDPVVIALVVHAERCFLARQPSFPPNFYSALAGFVEPGETLETAVRREVREEAGIDVVAATYVGSQPWPFPTSLMVGYIAEAAGEAFEIDRRELEDGRWFDRDEVLSLLARAPQPPKSPLLPPRGVMARRLIEEWIEDRSGR